MSVCACVSYCASLPNAYAKVAIEQVAADPWKSGEYIDDPREDEPSFYIVKEGDNFWSIAAHFAPDNTVTVWKRLIDENKSRLISSDVNIIYPGEELIVPLDG